MTMKSLLLGAAAGLVTVGAAQAADLPMTKAEAVEYVKVCTEFGAGFFYIPGSDTCLKISGNVRADYVFSEMHDRADDGVAFKGRAQIGFDARTATPYGMLRSFFLINGNIAPGGATSFSVDKAYIQFGGLTAGYAHSFYGIYDAEYGDTVFAGYFTYQNTTNLLAYTATFGGGFSATLSIEDGKQSRNGNVLFSDTNGLAAPPDNAFGNVVPYAGLTAPDVVGQLRLDQAWGKAAVQAAVHQLRGNDVLATGTPTGDNYYNTKYGYAVGGSLDINLPLAAGAHVVVEGNYAKGALGYLGVTNSVDWVQTVSTAKLSSGWSVAGEFGVDVTPALNITAFGSYADVKVPDLDGAGPVSALDDGFKAYILGINATYTIVKGLTVAGEVSYSDTKFKHHVVEDETLGPVNNFHTWSGGVRIKRSF